MSRTSSNPSSYRTSARRSSSRRTSNRQSGSGWGTTSGSRSSRTSRSKSTATRKTASSAKGGTTNYSTVKNQFEQKINSFRQLKTQAEVGKNRPSPTTLNRLASVVNQGGIIRKASTQAIKRTCRWSRPCTSASTALKALRSKFGPAVKAVVPAKNGGWLIAANPTWKGKPFKFGQ